MQKNMTPGRRKGCPNYSPEFKQQLVAASCEPGISISKLALENGINANLLFKWRQQWREGKLLLPSSESPQLLPVTLDATAVQPEPPAEDSELSICCEVTPEFKQQLVAASCEPGISISKLALENGINANLLFKWRQQWREGKLLLPSSESPQLLPVTLDATAVQPEPPAEDSELSICCEVTFRHGTLRLNGTVSEKLLTLLIQELKR
ncbi:IS66-like element accessory protein TnpA [Klebsiella pneumoniae]|uniref:IS66-like element accessory protein TnpA n=11 Tax=Klebsiella/Raoultella group TaxID=2890311 RepID=UPI0012F63C5D|nr:transposase [Klebsiella pneumoniae]